METEFVSSFIGNWIRFFFYWKLNSFLLLLETEFVSSFIGNWICFFFYWKLNSLLLLLETEFVSSFIGNCITFYLYRTLATFVVLWNIICTFSKYCRLSFSLVYSYLNRLEEGFCVFRNGLISILDWVFDNVWSCSTLFIMKTSHKSDELKKKKGGGGPQIGYLCKKSPIYCFVNMHCKMNIIIIVHCDTDTGILFTNHSYTYLHVFYASS